MFRYGTSHSLAKRPEKRDCSSQTVAVASTSNVSVTPDVACCSKSAPGESESTPLRKRKKQSTPQDRNTCTKCKIVYGSRMDDEYDSPWINCNHRGCDYWVHMYCVGLVVKESDMLTFEVVKFYCPQHNPNKILRPQSVAKKRL